MWLKRICSEVIVVLPHPFGDVEVPLEAWMEKGPGERKFLSPKAVKCRGVCFPAWIIPLRYQNNLFSRALIKVGILKDPWIGSTK